MSTARPAQASRLRTDALLSPRRELQTNYPNHPYFHKQAELNAMFDSAKASQHP